MKNQQLKEAKEKLLLETSPKKGDNVKSVQNEETLGESED